MKYDDEVPIYIRIYPAFPKKKSLFSSRNALRFSQFFLCALAVVDENIAEFIIIRSCRNKHENKMQIANFAQVIIHVGYKLSFYRFS